MDHGEKEIQQRKFRNDPLSVSDPRTGELSDRDVGPNINYGDTIRQELRPNAKKTNRIRYEGSSPGLLTVLPASSGGDDRSIVCFRHTSI